MLRVRGLTKRYGSLTAVEALAFEVRRGEVFGFPGPNGAGKTTAVGTPGRRPVRGQDSGLDNLRVLALARGGVPRWRFLVGKLLAPVLAAAVLLALSALLSALLAVPVALLIASPVFTGAVDAGWFAELARMLARALLVVSVPMCLAFLVGVLWPNRRRSVSGRRWGPARRIRGPQPPEPARLGRVGRGHPRAHAPSNRPDLALIEARPRKAIRARAGAVPDRRAA